MARKLGIDAQADGERNLAVVVGRDGFFETQRYPGYNTKAFVPKMKPPPVAMAQDAPLGDRSKGREHGAHRNVAVSRMSPYGYDFGTGRK